LPVSSNGKIDRKALPVPGRSRPELDTPLIAGRTLLEEELAQIWGEVLDLDQIGIHDNFLDLGGNSLTATRIISRVIARFQTEIPLGSLFQSPTVAEMAEVISRCEIKKMEKNELERILDELESLGEEEARRLVKKNTLKLAKK
jgi:acyl carrier protein